MKSMSRVFAVIAVVLIVLLGVATGVLSMRTVELRRQLEQESSARHSDSKTDAKAELLRRALEDQEIAYAELRDDFLQLKRSAAVRPASASPALPAVRPEPPPSPARGGDPVAWLDRIRSEDPEHYRQIMTAREERRRQTDDWYQDQLSRLDKRAQSSPSQQEVDLTTQIADTVAKLNDLRQQWDAVRALPEDERAAAAQQLQAETRMTYQQLNDLARQDRNVQFGNLFRNIGITDVNAVQGYVDNLNQILQDTRYAPPRGGGPGGPGGPGGWFGGGGGTQTQSGGMQTQTGGTQIQNR
jgi:hypothetical protein